MIARQKSAERFNPVIYCQSHRRPGLVTIYTAVEEQWEDHKYRNVGMGLGGVKGPRGLNLVLEDCSIWGATDVPAKSCFDPCRVSRTKHDRDGGKQGLTDIHMGQTKLHAKFGNNSSSSGAGVLMTDSQRDRRQTDWTVYMLYQASSHPLSHQSISWR